VELDAGGTAEVPRGGACRRRDRGGGGGAACCGCRGDGGGRQRRRRRECHRRDRGGGGGGGGGAAGHVHLRLSRGASPQSRSEREEWVREYHRSGRWQHLAMACKFFISEASTEVRKTRLNRAASPLWCRISQPRQHPNPLYCIPPHIRRRGFLGHLREEAHRFNGRRLIALKDTPSSLILATTAWAHSWGVRRLLSVGGQARVFRPVAVTSCVGTARSWLSDRRTGGGL